MKNAAAAVAIMLALAPFGAADAQQASGSLTVTARVEGSVGLRIKTGDATSLTNAVPIRFPASSRTFSMPVAVEVSRANMSTTGCVLLARLRDAPAEGTTWMVNGETITDAIPASLALNGSGTSTVNLTLTVRTATTRSARQIANELVFGVQAR